MVSYAGSPAVEERVRTFLHQLEPSVEVKRSPLPIASRRERIFGTAARALFREALPKADVLHLHGVWESIIRIGAAESRRLSTPYVVTPHGMLDPWSLAQRRWKKRLALALGYRRAVDGAAFLHCLNEDEARLLAPLGLTCRTRTIPNGISVEEFASLPQAGTFRRQHPELGDAPYVIFLARLHYKKGLDHLARAFEILVGEIPEAHLVVAGPDGGERGNFQAAIARTGLQARVHVLGPIYGADKLAALVDASVFCLPSRQEGFSVAILEALACATPVVITDNCHFPEVVRWSAGHVVPLDAAAVAQALAKTISNPDTARRMGEAGRAMVQQHYTWPDIARQSIDAYVEARTRTTSGAAGSPASTP
jgi:glycosyltransferase involved in cell wall biosynthesis